MTDFEFLLFSTDPDYVRHATEAGIDGFIVDREYIGKPNRQQGLDTQINYDTFDDLKRVRQNTDVCICCRINNVPEIRRAEAKEAIAYGANEIFLPMVKSLAEIEDVADVIGSNAELSILIETEEGIALASQLKHVSVKRVYIGLNDLALQRGLKNIFESVRDGTVEQIRNNLPSHIPFGFAGLTSPPNGHPIPTELLMAEMIRVGASFTYLRRSFKRDVPVENLKPAVLTMRNHLAVMRQRTSEEIIRHQTQLYEVIEAITRDMTEKP